MGPSLYLRTVDGEIWRRRPTIYIHSLRMIVCFLYYSSRLFPFFISRLFSLAVKERLLNGGKWLCVSLRLGYPFQSSLSHFITRKEIFHFISLECHWKSLHWNLMRSREAKENFKVANSLAFLYNSLFNSSLSVNICCWHFYIEF